MLSLIHSSSTVHTYGCVIVTLIKGKFTSSTEDAYVLFSSASMKESSVFMKEIYEFWLLKCVRLAITFHFPIYMEFLK